MITQLRAEGYAIEPDFELADMVIVNTCGFIDSAVEESLASIDEALQQNGQVIVTGCLGARAEVIRERFPSLLAITGPQARDEVMQAVHRIYQPRTIPFSTLSPNKGYA